MYYGKSVKLGTFNRPYTSLTKKAIAKFTTVEAGTGRRYKEYPGGKSYLDESPGRPIPSWWTDIHSLGQTISNESLGYPTQKPLALLERIIKASSNPGDVVLDPFAGCATTCVVAQQLDRKWIGIDIEGKAAQLLLKRLSDDAGMFSEFIHRVDIPERTDVKIEEPNKSVKDRLHKSQKGVCKGCKGTYLLKDFEIDHITPRVKGGGNYYLNYQLLCGSCNRIKGPRNMEFLMDRVAKNEAHLKANTYG